MEDCKWWPNIAVIEQIYIDLGIFVLMDQFSTNSGIGYFDFEDVQ